MVGLNVPFGSSKEATKNRYYVSMVGLNEATIKKYIQEQEKSDIMQDKLSVKKYEDPFKG